MAEETIDQKARDGVLELKGDMKLAASQIDEARKDIARLDASFSKAGDERKKQFQWLMTLLCTIAIGVGGLVVAVFRH